MLGFDVYRRLSAATVRSQEDEGYDLTKFHEETWEGQPVYVLGDGKGELKSKQFSVDKNRLLVRAAADANANGCEQIPGHPF